jgi:hypothetical protein
MHASEPKGDAATGRQGNTACSAVRRRFPPALESDLDTMMLASWPGLWPGGKIDKIATAQHASLGP